MRSWSGRDAGQRSAGALDRRDSESEESESLAGDNQSTTSSGTVGSRSQSHADFSGSSEFISPRLTGSSSSKVLVHFDFFFSLFQPGLASFFLSFLLLHRNGSVAMATATLVLPSFTAFSNVGLVDFYEFHLIFLSHCAYFPILDCLHNVT